MAIKSVWNSYEFQTDFIARTSGAAADYRRSLSDRGWLRSYRGYLWLQPGTSSSRWCCHRCWWWSASSASSHRGSSWNSVLSAVFIYHNVTSNSIKIGSLLGSGCPSGRDNADAVFLVTIAMAHNANLLRFDRSDNEEALFIDGVTGSSKRIANAS